MSKQFRALLVFLILACFLGSCAAQIRESAAPGSVTTDGAWWAQRTAAEKGLAVEAAINGYRWGYADAQLTDSLTAMSINDRKALEAMKTSTPTFDKTIASYIAAIDAFYGKYPESRSATVADILGCLYVRPKQSCDALARSQRSN